jgi:N-carbamoyl-L-amino-acid hydrolase
MNANALHVDIERIKADILSLAAIGRNEADRGLYRMAFTDADMEAKRWLLHRIEENNLTPASDGAANVSGILPGKTADKRIYVGSHIDTVPCAGALDGTLGVVVGLECLRVLRESGVTPQKTVELIAFSDEEGRFGGMFGSEAFCGFLDPDRLESATDLDGLHLTEAMLRQGLDPIKALDARRDPTTIECYLELHIEQGPVLDQELLQVGIVEQITGLQSWSLRLLGESNHAGTTPMAYRKDALMGLADFAHEIPRILEENGQDTSRATIGKAQIQPGAPNTVPGIVEFSLDFRVPSTEVLQALADAFQKALGAICRRRGLHFEFSVQGDIQPVASAEPLVNLLEQQAKHLGLRHRRMLSGAAHDAQLVGRIAPMVMLFVPSKSGQSHSPAEWTSWDDIEAGGNLMLHALLALAADTADDA